MSKPNLTGHPKWFDNIPEVGDLLICTLELKHRPIRCGDKCVVSAVDTEAFIFTVITLTGDAVPVPLYKIGVFDKVSTGG